MSAARTATRSPWLAALGAVGLVGALGLVLPACGGRGDGPAWEGDSAALGVKVVWAREARALAGGGPADAPPEGEPPPGIDAFRLCVTGADIPATVCANFPVAQNMRGGALDVPIGTGRILSLQGFDSQSRRVLWCGETLLPEIKKGETVTARLFATRCGALTSTNALANGRAFHTATRLRDGRVVVIGGFDIVGEAVERTRGPCGMGCQPAEATDSIELYDPKTGTFERLDLRLQSARAFHTATLLPDGHSILVYGGCNAGELHLGEAAPVLKVADPSACPKRAEVVDVDAPEADAIIPVDTAENLPRVFHQAFAAPDGSVLIFGGLTSGQESPRCPAELFDPERFEMERVDGTERTCRQSFAATVLPPGNGDDLRVLVVGGAPAGPAANPGEIVRFSRGADLEFDLPSYLTGAKMGEPLYHGVAVTFRQKKVLVVGGLHGPGMAPAGMTPALEGPVPEARLIETDASDVDVLSGGAGPRFPRTLHTATLMRDGRILITGGAVLRADKVLLPEAFVEVYDGQKGVFQAIQVDSQALTLGVKRLGHVATDLGDGTVLISGGFNGSEVTEKAEIFNSTPSTLRIPVHPTDAPTGATGGGSTGGGASGGGERDGGTGDEPDAGSETGGDGEQG